MILGHFESTHILIVLFHTDLEPRNVFGMQTQARSRVSRMVRESASGSRKADASRSHQLKWVSPGGIPLDPGAADIRQHFLHRIDDVSLGFVDIIRYTKPILDLLTFDRLGLYSVVVIKKACSSLGIEY
jgi:hypothetical protein